MNNPQNPYELNLDKNQANYVPLSPIGFLERSARVFPNYVSTIHGNVRYSWSETYTRCQQLASSIQNLGLQKGDTVSVMAPNIPAMFESHFGIPMAGAVLNTLNTRLDADTIAFILDHAETKLLLTDTEFSQTIDQALGKVNRDIIVVDIIDDALQHTKTIGETNYEEFLLQGESKFRWHRPADEWEAISLNYTSGTTGNPKGVVYSYRGTYLNALSNALNWKMTNHPTYLWTLPMFHCNGWCFPWTIAMLSGTNVCLRRVNAQEIFSAIDNYNISHFCGAPIVLGMVINATNEERKKFEHIVNVMTAAAPPPAAVLESMENLGFHMTHVYGLTETYGPAVICEWHNEWNQLSKTEQARLKSRQGVPYTVLNGLEVMDPATMSEVAQDGNQMGEVMFSGNNVMKGYLKNPEATDEAFAGGWFHSGDLGVMHSDRYVQLKDRSKDVIISGGENISSIEIEDVLFQHPAVLEAAVVAKADEYWGETPCAFVNLKSDYSPAPTAQELIEHCKQNMARYKAPRYIIFSDLPKTSTGKIQKYILRERTDEV